MAGKLELECNAEEKERIFALLRLGAERALVLVSRDEVIQQMEQAGMYGAGEYSGQDDPVLIAATRRAIRSSLIHWLNSTIEKPTHVVEPFVSENIVENSIAMIELGVPELMFSLDRAAQNVAWQYWMNVAFEICDNPRDLQLLLDVSFRSIASYIDGSRDLLQSILSDYSNDKERASLAKKRDLVIKVLEGGGAQSEIAAKKLGYTMRKRQCSAVIWSDEANIELSRLESAVELFVKALGKPEHLSVITSTQVVWLWTAIDEDVDRNILRTFLRQLDSIKITYSIAGKGLEGFRKSHMDALAAQRILGRLRSGANVVSYEQLRLAEMLSRDLDATNSFIGHVLGDLEKAPKELRQTLLAYIEVGCNASKAAEVLHTHRNTLLRRLSRAEELLPRPLQDNLVQVSAALDLSKWLS